MARNGFLLLLVANLLFFGWSRWVGGRDEPAAAGEPLLPPAAATTEPAPEPPPTACTSIGPYETEDAAFAVASKLASTGRESALRGTPEDVPDGWWVFIDGLPDAASQRTTVARIKRAGIDDATAMPDDPEFRVSVGLFSERQRADQRARSIEKLGLGPRVAEHVTTKTRYWIDLAGIAPQELGPEVLLGANIDSVPGELVACP